MRALAVVLLALGALAMTAFGSISLFAGDHGTAPLPAGGVIWAALVIVVGLVLLIVIAVTRRGSWLFPHEKPLTEFTRDPKDFAERKDPRPPQTETREEKIARIGKVWPSFAAALPEDKPKKR